MLPVFVIVILIFAIPFGIWYICGQPKPLEVKTVYVR